MIDIYHLEVDGGDGNVENGGWIMVDGRWSEWNTLLFISPFFLCEIDQQYQLV